MTARLVILMDGHCSPDDSHLYTLLKDPESHRRWEFSRGKLSSGLEA
jgi:hypothetical protein